MKSNFGLRLLALVLSLVMIVSVFTACKDEKDPTKDTSKDQGTQQEAEGAGFTGTITSQFILKSTEDYETIEGKVDPQKAQYKYTYALPPGDFCIVKDNQPVCQIVVDESYATNTKAEAAALELQNAIKQMTGATIEIVDVKTLAADALDGTYNLILVGKSKITEELEIDIPSGAGYHLEQEPTGELDADNKPIMKDVKVSNEGYRIIAKGNILALAGNDEYTYTGTQDAVVAFLNSIGFGFYGDDDLWKVVPTAATVYAAECDITTRPDFLYRFSRNYAKGTSATETGSKYSFLGGSQYYVEHNLPALLKWGGLYSEEPDWFAFSPANPKENTNWTRNPSGKKHFMPCLSNKDFQAFVIDYIIDWFDKNPSAISYSIGQSDGDLNKNGNDYIGLCECDACREFAPGGTAGVSVDITIAMMKFAAIIGNGIKAEHPDKCVNFYAYFDTFDAPETYEVDFDIAADNVLILLCHQGGLTGFMRNGDGKNADIGQKEFKQNVEDWKKLGYTRFGLYEWNCPGASDKAWQDAYWIQGEAFIDNAKWLKEQGFEFIWIDGGNNVPSYERQNHWDIRWPLWYINAMAMYDTSVTYDQLMHDACRKLYGDAEAIMYKFYKKLNDISKNCPYYRQHWHMPTLKEFYSDNDISELTSIMMEARKQGEKIGGVIQERIENQYTNLETMKSRR